MRRKDDRLLVDKKYGYHGYVVLGLVRLSLPSAACATYKYHYIRTMWETAFDRDVFISFTCKIYKNVKMFEMVDKDGANLLSL